MPESLMFVLRLNKDSIRSPNVPKIMTITAIAIQSVLVKIGKIRLIKYPATIVRAPPPIVPSQDFLGETLSNNLCLPSGTPTQYAMLSYIQINNKIPSKIVGLKFSVPT